MMPRLVPTPLGPPAEWPEERPGGIAQELLAACLTPTGGRLPLDRLQHPDAVVVTTGQQPGLFLGPLYAVHKALSAAALARILESRWQRPVIPIFWIAGDDHDFTEANHAAWLDAHGAVVTATLRARPPEAPLTPMYREPLGPEVEAALRLLGEGLPPSEFRDETVDWLRRHYRPEATVGGAFGGALAELLAPFGVVCLDSTHAAVKRAAAGVIVRAAGLARELDGALAERARALAEADNDPGIGVGDGASLVMLEAALGRDRLVLDGDGFLTRRSQERLSRRDVEAIADTSPERLSGNVLLRPVVESAILPTVAYVGGPGELRYLTLTVPIYEGLGIRRQLPIPRWSGLLVEPRVDRVLGKFGATLEELMAPDAALEARVVQSQVPEDSTAALEDLRRALEDGYGRLQRAAVEVDPTLERPIQGYLRHALSGLRDAEKKLLQHLKRRQEVEMGQIERARNAVLPHGKPQERVLSAVSFLARYGPELLAGLAEAAHASYADALVGRAVPS